MPSPTPSRPLALVERLLGTLWFVPGAMLTASIGLAVGFIELDALWTYDLAARMPRLFGVGADGSRGMLQAIAGSMITVAGVTFSITMVTLSLTSSQYSPRIIRSFIRDQFNQLVLGTFLGTFTYCLVVLRVVRGGDEGRFVPSMAVLFAVVLALVSVGMLVAFIDHVASSIQVATLLAKLSRETIEVVRDLFPEPDDGEDAGEPPRAPDVIWYPIAAAQSGYIQHSDLDRLAALATERRGVFRLEHAVGDFVIAKSPVISFGGAKPDDELRRIVGECFDISDLRTIEQDAAFGLQVLVDVGLKALSPGINDTTTAVDAVNHISSVLACLAVRRIDTPHRFDGAQIRVIAREVGFGFFSALALGPMRRNAQGNATVLGHLVDAIGAVGGFARAPERRAALLRELDLVLETCDTTIAFAADRSVIHQNAITVRRRVMGGDGVEGDRRPDASVEHPLAPVSLP